VHLRRGIATILTAVVAAGDAVAVRGIAALHRLPRHSHAEAVESIRRESDGQCRHENYSRGRIVQKKGRPLYVPVRSRMLTLRQPNIHSIGGSAQPDPELQRARKSRPSAGSNGESS
jgi:hypothetical protein